ncbi:coagulation factor V [Melanotaenia boesemani]|uniref:coagulation factor V n=1 Tax=Melanotaenia boesemani TaxID=1250792 RepID=UPI001C03CC02|nr:coagulation factor V [Melanotaenia boesemani]
MRLCLWAGAHCLLPALVLLTILNVKADQNQPKERHYYIAAVEIDWNYSGNDTNRFGPTYKKVVFREYDRDFRRAKTHPAWLGLLGPTLRAEEGETIVVTFRNMATGAYSIHPHGVAYGKQSEGASYFDNTSLKEKEDDIVQPNGEHVYYWEVTPGVSPQPDDPTCLTYTYISHQNVVQDYNSGLIGTLLICKPGSLDESGKQVGVHQEYVFLFGVFDENESMYSPSGHAPDEHVKYTINGYTKGSLPDVRMCAYTSVSLHLVGMSSEPELFSVHMNGQVLTQTGHKVSSVGLISGSTATASTVPLHPGRWLLSSHTIKHMEVGLHGFVDVKECDGFERPTRKMTIAQKRQSTEWTYYIAAEEVVWDYSPNMPDHIDQDFKQQYLRRSSTRIGGRYKKAVYTQYKNESFTERMENNKRKSELGILGPVIRAQVRDVIKIVFKNMASRPYSIYPHGLAIEKSEEGVNYPDGGNHSHGVQPGETHTYEWKVLEENEPLGGDARCLTRMYHSAVNTPRDIASGLIGPILICKSQSLNVRNVQLKADKEQHAAFAVFDENQSWYLDDNIRQYCDRSQVNKADPDFYQSNVMHTINGYSFESGPLLGFCNGEVATWHVSSIGAQDFIQTATFYGHPFELNDRTEDFLSLYPMTGETITMNMDNIGYWLLASLNTHETTRGVRVKFRDVKCFRDYQYEYESEDSTSNEFTVWKPATLDAIKKEEATPAPTKEIPVVVDTYTEIFADELGLRSLKNKSIGSDVEHLDLSFLDYDVIDVQDGDVKSSLNSLEIKTKTEPSQNPDALNETQHSNWKKLNGTNHEGSNYVSDSLNRTVYNATASVAGNVSADTTNLTATLQEIGNLTVPLQGTNLTILLQETTNLTITLPGNSNSMSKNETVNVTLLSDGLTSVDVVIAEDSEEKRTRGDVFAYDVPPSKPDSLNNTSNSSVFNATLDTMMEDWNNTAEKHVNMSDFGTNHSLSIPQFDVDEVNVSSTDTHNLTIAEPVAENTGNNGSKPAIAADAEHSSEVVTVSANSSLENATHVLLKTGLLPDITVNVSGSDLSSRSSSESEENVTAILGKLNKTSSVESVSKIHEVSSNMSLSGGTVKQSSSEKLGASDSSEEVFIYLKENKTEAIKTSSFKPQGHNWTYDGAHYMVPEEIPDHIKKYFEEETPPTPPQKRTKKVTLRKRPKKGQGMKTKRRKQYKPQARSGLPFSPRGFHPGMTPRGSRPLSPQPVSDEENLSNASVIIGIPRHDFSDYQLFVPGNEPGHLDPNDQDVIANEYEFVMYKDPYSSNDDIKNLNLDEITKYYLELSGPDVKTYFIAAEEVEWDYAGYGQRRQEKTLLNSRETKFTKVVFRSYLDGSFSTPDIRGELDEHLGILGPVIKAEVGQSIMVVFRNNANRPYSIHPNGVSYTKQFEGLSYEDDSRYWFKYDNEVQPNTTYTYSWKVSPMVGPSPGESNCRTWAYYSGVNPEKDIHSGLIGPLLVCRGGTLNNSLPNSRDFMLLFMTFDESQSWYYEKNRELMQRKSRKQALSANHKDNLKFHSINGIIFSLKGLRMYTNQLVRWHLINMGSPTEFHSVHFHGQTFIHKKTKSYRQAVYPLLPGGFATLEMYPSKPGLWQLETEVGFHQKKGMQTLFLVLDNECYRPLGLESGSVDNDHITAINTRGYWEPHLARLNNQGKYNAWSTETNNSWIQVDFQRPVVISQVATQGAKQMFQSQYVKNYLISYSNDRRKWIYYKGNSNDFWKIFPGNKEAYETKVNTFFPPVIGRFIRLHPLTWYSTATVRMEFYGCELDGCSVPLGMETRQIQDHQITASSIGNSWFGGSWNPSLARLNLQGTINAWRPKHSDMNQWLQIELPKIKKITGIITQGAKSMGKEMYVISYTLLYSDNGIHWTRYTDDEEQPVKIFLGNTNNNDHVKNYIYPPIFSRFIRIIPQSWMGSITMRVELLGCDFE